MPSPARKPARRKKASPRPARQPRAKAIALAVAPPPQLISPLPERRSSLGRTLLAMALMVLAALALVLAYVRFGHPGQRSVQVELPAPSIAAVPAAPAPELKPHIQPASKPASPKPPRAASRARFPMTFSLEQSADEPAELAVFPQHGKALRVVKADSAAAGKVSLIWDGLDSQGNSLAAGSYYLRLNSSKAEIVRSITIQ